MPDTIYEGLDAIEEPVVLKDNVEGALVDPLVELFRDHCKICFQKQNELLLQRTKLRENFVEPVSVQP